MITLGIETSCDETAIAVVEDGFVVRANLIASQVLLHERFGGVVPEVAARAHVEALNPLLEETLAEAGVGFDEIDAVAVTTGPGLAGALLVGMAGAKAVALATGADLIGVNHLEGHYWANFLEHGPPDPPYVTLIVSGGHTMLVHVPEMFHHVVLGQTLDDAAGEAFDKVARLIGLGFPGDRRSTPWPARAIRTRSGSRGRWRIPAIYDFSLSGLKTAVLRHVKAAQAAGQDLHLPDLAASFQEAIVDVQVSKTIAAATAMSVSTVLLGGGVVANTRLRERLAAAGEREGIRVLFPSMPLCAPTTRR